MATFNDPSFVFQWQLGPGTGINATPLYDEYTGAGLRIGLVDTGLDYANPDFAGQVDLQNDYDALGKDNDANNVGGDQHGTEVGLILAAAANNNYGRVGAAFGATLVAYRFDTRWLRTIEQETTLLKLQNEVDISHNSWSRSGEFFRDNFNNPDYAAAAAAIANTATVGRGGLGTVIVRSSGNDGVAGDDVNTHSYYNNRYTIVVGATAQDGTVQAFSNPSAALTVVAPGTATSWAAPLGSATAALMLEANPNLGYRDVAVIMSLTAKVTDPTGAGWFTNAGQGWNGGGLHVSRKAGFGLIDAVAAVRLAETWTAQSTEANRVEAQASGAGPAIIPDRGAMSHTVQISSSLLAERAEVEVDITHEKIGDLRVVLVSPGGTESVLLDRVGKGSYDAASGKLVFTLTSTQFLWENAQGEWTLRVEDATSLNTGTLQSWTLRLHGSAPTDDNIHVYTNEYASFYDTHAARGVLSDGSGNDTLNAAAVSGASMVNLSSGAVSWIAGRSLTIAADTLIENAITGDGADQIIGNGLANRLSGMRGNDWIYGEAGNDTLMGGENDDVLNGGVGADDMRGGQGHDQYYVDDASDTVTELDGEGSFDSVLSSISYILSANIERLYLTGAGNTTGTGNSLNNEMNGNAGANLLDGGLGNDWINGGAGNDTLMGGENDDVLNGGVGADDMRGGQGHDQYYVDDASDTVTELDGEGSFDSVLSSISYILSANIERLYLTGAGNTTGTGNSLNNEMNGNAGANLLDGGLGNDWINGGAGNDTLMGGENDDVLNGGVGADDMRGGQGHDQYYVDDASDTVTELDGEGSFDSVLSSISYILSANIERLYLTGAGNTTGTGNSLNNEMNGNAGANLLDGGLGNDWINGGAGNDTLMGGQGDDTFIFQQGAGRDVVRDFTSGQDRINIRGLAQGIQVSDLTQMQVGNDVEIHYGSDVLVLEGVSTSILNYLDFLS